jgi:hypothetical protein
MFTLMFLICSIDTADCTSRSFNEVLDSLEECEANAAYGIVKLSQTLSDNRLFIVHNCYDWNLEENA